MAQNAERHHLMRAAFVVTLLAGVGFAAHAVWRITLHAPDNGGMRVEDWMSARHVTRVFALPADELAPLVGGAAGAPLPPGPLRDLAAAQGLSPEALVAQVQARIDARGDTS